MQDGNSINQASASLEELQALKTLKHDPRFNAAGALKKAGEAITAPAYTQESSAALVIGSTLSGLARSEALREKGESLPQNLLKARLAADASSLTEETGKGAVLREIT
ncbi:hypothetical protein LJB82_02635 [Desulfovibrio sp. OttesenSCG-928-M16]|nr:hypothetical protein [Desulfovibrio sp. OttesenSCG-928-M16]